MASVRCSTASSSSTNSHSACRSGEVKICGCSCSTPAAARLSRTSLPATRSVVGSAMMTARFPGNSSRNISPDWGRMPAPIRSALVSVAWASAFSTRFISLFFVFVCQFAGRSLSRCCCRSGLFAGVLWPLRMPATVFPVGSMRREFLFLSESKDNETKRNMREGGPKRKMAQQSFVFLCSAEKFPIFAPNWFSPSLPGRGMKREPGVNPGLSRSCDAP